MSVPFIARVPETFDSPFPAGTPTIPNLTGLDLALENLMT